MTFFVCFVCNSHLLSLKLVDFCGFPNDFDKSAIFTSLNVFKFIRIFYGYAFKSSQISFTDVLSHLES